MEKEELDILEETMELPEEETPSTGEAPAVENEESSSSRTARRPLLTSAARGGGHRFPVGRGDRRR